ncbi:thioredoxin-dependent thiol peroxidase [Candidatus Saccharibacteria bacterium]|nr:thioredoxin-dependent thiol peroxidase [Candidatus Saccharibacteria bacterium]
MKIPTFSLQDQNENTITDKDLLGSWTLIYFYPKDNTPGCTVEACSFRDGREMLEQMGLRVIGISKDSVKSHKKFVDKFNLNFTLLSDESTKVIEAFGSWKLKKFMGREYMGINRDSYLVNPEGEIVKKYEGVNPKTHIKEIVEDFKELSR